MATGFSRTRLRELGSPSALQVSASLLSDLAVAGRSAGGVAEAEVL